MAKVISIMQDNLEKFVSKNREAFDDAVPNSNIWTNIEEQLDATLTKQDNLETFVNKNREAFDSAEPNLNIWANIEQQLDTTQTKTPSNVVQMQPNNTRRVRRFQYLRVAAIALVCMMVGGVIGSYLTSSQLNQPSEIALHDISEEYAEIEEHYAQQVDFTFNEIKQFDYDRSIEVDLAELDEAYQKLSKELAETPNIDDEQIIDAMIENYQLKIKILERVLLRLKAQKGGQSKVKQNTVEL